jgi:hypothetical protein
VSDIVDKLGQYLKRVDAAQAWSWVPGIRMHPDDIGLLPRTEPKPIWAGGGLSPLMGTPIFADETITRGGYEVATREWIADRARAAKEDEAKIEVTDDSQADTYVGTLEKR